MVAGENLCDVGPKFTGFGIDDLILLFDPQSE
jgi:hypothetical protein